MSNEQSVKKLFPNFIGPPDAVTRNQNAGKNAAVPQVRVSLNG
jgi:hypothetical protein